MSVDTSNEDFLNSFTEEGSSETPEQTQQTQQQSEQTVETTQAETPQTTTEEVLYEPNSEVQAEESTEEEAPATEGGQKSFSETLAERFPGLTEEKVEELISQADAFEKLKDAESYRTELGKQFDELVAPVEKGGRGVPPDVAARYLSDTSQMSDLEYLALHTKLENPSFTDDEVNRLIEMEYSIGKYAKIPEDVIEEDMDTARKDAESDGLLRLKKDVTQLRKDEKSMKEKMIESFKSRSDVESTLESEKSEKAELARKESWKPVTKELKSSLDKMKIPVGDKDGKPLGFFNFKLEDSVKEKVIADVERFVERTSGIQPDQDGISHVKENIVKLSVLSHALPQVADALIKYGSSLNRSEMSAELNNTDFKHTQHQNAAGAEEEDIYDSIMKQLDKN